MTRFLIDLARPDDDPALRRLLAANAMEGSIELAFEREPSYFLASGVQAPFHQVIVARDAETREAVGVGFRGVRRTWLNGRAEDVGYLGDLRLHPAHRGGSLVARGYRYLRKLHGDGLAPLYLTVIAEGNRKALDTIAAGRAGLPRYEPLGRICSPAVSLERGARPGSVNRCAPDDVAAVLGCLQRNLSRKQFAPVVETLTSFPNLSLDDVYVARRKGEIIGVVVKWDQSAFKQTRVVGYHGAVRFLRPLYNAAAPLLGVPRYPPAGQTLRSFYAAFIAIDDDDPAVLRAILQRIQSDHAGSGYHYFVLGLHEKDPLRAALRGFRLTPFYAQAFAVHFDDGDAAFGALDNRLPYVELSML